MSTKREEERNEKIIRGLMKLPPNRRCINCNALGPQYVCTTFWTFVCMTCSGIHREFTHRVKSVSMSKFTSQEVEALQKGGNQRAREIYLKGWDPLRQRLPDNSNAEKVRTFIKSVFVDKKYAEGKSSDKPPRDLQHQRSLEEETRRASSYHSYSQSPPYDFQYEERRYGKHALVLTRKTGSDRGLYEGKISSFLSPSRLSDNIYEDRFANEGSNSRMSDYSVSSRSDPFRSDIQSPNFQKDIGSPFSETSREFSAEDLQHHTGKDGAKVLHPQRTMSTGSFGSFDSNSMSFKSVNSAGLVEVAPEPVQSMETHQNELSTSASLPRPSVTRSSDALDLFSAPFAPQNATSVVSESNKSQFPESGTPSLNLFEPPDLTAPTFSAHHPAQTLASSSLNLFPEMPQQLPAATVNKRSPDMVTPQNEGWATFDSQNVTTAGVENATPAMIPSSHGNSVGNFDPLSPVQWSSFEDSAAHRPPSSSLGLWQDDTQNVLPGCNAASTQWPSFQDFSANGPSLSTPTVWNESQQIVGASSNTIGTQSWNAFEDSDGKLPTQSTQTSSEQVEMQHPSIVDGHLAFGVLKDLSGDGIQRVAVGTDLRGDGIQRAAVDTGHSFSGRSSNVSMPLDDISKHVVVEAHPYETGHKPINPFDLPYDSDVDSSNMAQFWDMSSLQAALPNGDVPVPFAGGVTQPWFDPAPATAYVPAGPQEALGFMSRQAPGSQILNVQTQGPVATIGGNPFA